MPGELVAEPRIKLVDALHRRFHAGLCWELEVLVVERSPDDCAIRLWQVRPLGQVSEPG